MAIEDPMREEDSIVSRVGSVFPDCCDLVDEPRLVGEEAVHAEGEYRDDVDGDEVVVFGVLEATLVLRLAV